MRLKRIGFLLFLVLSVANAFAEPDYQRRDERREAIRAYHIQAVTMERGAPPERVQPPQPQDPRRPGMVVPESSGYGSVGEGQSNQQQDNMRRQGKMSPEERRALRRQIDEAGHDIYSPKR